MLKTLKKMKVWWIAEILILLVAFFCCFLPEKQTYCFFGEDIQEMLDEGEFKSDEFCLTPGVYEVRMKTHLDRDNIFVQVRSDSAYYKSLQNNGMIVWMGEETEDFFVYVSETVPAAYIYCDFGRAPAEELIQVEVVRTNAGNRILFVLILNGIVCLNGMLFFRKNILDGKISFKKLVAFWSIFVAVLIACFPCFTDYLVTGDDIYFHLSRIGFLRDALVDGERFPVKMQGTWVYGHGYATSIFYGDLFLYIPAVLNLVGFPIMVSYKIFLCFITIVTAIISYLSFKRCLKDESSAALGSILYLLMPYRLHNVYGRAALGEYIAMAFLPMVFCGMYLLYTENVNEKQYSKYKWWLIAGISGILQSHLITAEMVAMLMALVCVVYYRKTFTKRTFLQLLAMSAYVLIINAWFLIPMFYMLSIDNYDLTRVVNKKIQDAGVSFAGYLQLLPNYGTGYENRPLQLGTGIILPFALAGYYTIKHINGKRSSENTYKAVTAISILAVILSSRKFPWDILLKIPVIGAILGVVQFPYRWLSPGALFISVLGAMVWKKLENKESLLRICLYAGIVAQILIGVYYVNDTMREGKSIYLYNIENMGTTAVVNGEYLVQGTDVVDMYYHAPAAWEGLNYSEYEKEGARIRIRVENTTDEEQILVLPLFGYRGYGVKILEGEVSPEEIPYISEARSEHGDLEVVIPAGYEGKLLIYYRGFPVFTVAELVSLVTILLIAGKFLIPEILRCFRGEKIREV